MSSINIQLAEADKYFVIETDELYTPERFLELVQLVLQKWHDHYVRRVHSRKDRKRYEMALALEAEGWVKPVT
jgi:hypothetical protein